MLFLNHRGDGTHNKKRTVVKATRGRHPLQKTAYGGFIFIFKRRKGMTPIEKNVKVVDEKGNILEATWPKRAKGLVKSGRARFVDENTICLACPPNKILEDNKMDNINIDKTTGEVIEIPASKYNLEYALEQIERIANDKEYLTEAFDALYAAASNNEATLEQGGSNDKVAEAVADTIRVRETTNQKLIEFYSKMVDDLKPAKPTTNEAFQAARYMIGDVIDAIKDSDWDDEEEKAEAIKSVMATVAEMFKDKI